MVVKISEARKKYTQVNVVKPVYLYKRGHLYDSTAFLLSIGL